MEFEFLCSDDPLSASSLNEASFMRSSCIVSTNRSKSPCRTKTVFRIVSCAFLEEVIFAISFLPPNLFLLFAKTLLSSSTNWSAVLNKPDATHAVISSSSELKPCSCTNPMKLLASGSSSKLFRNECAKCSKPPVPNLAFPRCVESSFHEYDPLLVLEPSLLEPPSFSLSSLFSLCSASSSLDLLLPFFFNSTFNPTFALPSCTLFSELMFNHRLKVATSCALNSHRIFTHSFVISFVSSNANSDRSTSFCIVAGTKMSLSLLTFVPAFRYSSFI